MTSQNGSSVPKSLHDLQMEIQSQNNSSSQQVVMSTANLHGVTSVMPQGAVLMQQPLPPSANQGQTPSKVTIINQQGSSSLSQLSLLAQHPQGHVSTPTNQIQIVSDGTSTTISKPGATIQRQVLPVQSLPAGHTSVQMVASIHQGAGHILTPINIQSSPQKHTNLTTQRPIAPHGISVQQTTGTPMVIQVSAPPGTQTKPTLVPATSVVRNAPHTIVAQSCGNDATKQNMNNTAKITQQNLNQGLHSAEVVSNDKVLSRKRIQELLQEIDPRATLDEDVEELLLQIADDFIESVVNASCQVAKHRKSSVLDVKDIQLHLERNWNMWIPGYGTEDFKQSKKLGSTEAHKQRLAVIRKSMKK